MPKKRHLEAKPYLCDVWEEGEDDGEIEVVCRGAHVNLVWRAGTGWRGRPWRVDGGTIFLDRRVEISFEIFKPAYSNQN